jgi:hypothetical protein
MFQFCSGVTNLCGNSDDMNKFFLPLPQFQDHKFK